MPGHTAAALIVASRKQQEPLVTALDRHKGGAAHQPEARPEPRSLSPTAARSRSDPLVTSHPGPRHSSWFANYFFMDEVSCAKKLMSVTMQSSRPCAQFGHLFRVALQAPWQTQISCSLLISDVIHAILPSCQ